MVAVVGRIKDKSVVQEPFGFQLLHYSLYHFVHGLQGPQTRALELVIILDHGLVELREVLHPAHTAWSIGIKVGRPWDLVVFEEVCVPRSVLCHVERDRFDEADV